MLSSSQHLDFLNNRITVRHKELGLFISLLSEESDRFERRGRKLRVTTIILGAFSAAQGVVLQVSEGHSALTSILFAMIGVAVAAIAGIESVFKYEARASELRMLAAKCQAARFQNNSEWAYRIALAKPDEGLPAARDLLAVQDRILGEVQLEAAKLGMNLVRASEDELPEGTTGEQVLTKRADSDLPPPKGSQNRFGHLNLPDHL